MFNDNEFELFLRDSTERPIKVDPIHGRFNTNRLYRLSWPDGRQTIVKIYATTVAFRKELTALRWLADSPLSGIVPRITSADQERLSTLLVSLRRMADGAC